MEYGAARAGLRGSIEARPRAMPPPGVGLGASGPRGQIEQATGRRPDLPARRPQAVASLTLSERPPHDGGRGRGHGVRLPRQVRIPYLPPPTPLTLAPRSTPTRLVSEIITNTQTSPSFPASQHYSIASDKDRVGRNLMESSVSCRSIAITIFVMRRAVVLCSFSTLNLLQHLSNIGRQSYQL